MTYFGVLKTFLIVDIVSTSLAMVVPGATEFYMPKPLLEWQESFIEENIVYLLAIAAPAMAMLILLIVAWVGCFMRTKWGFVCYVVAVAIGLPLNLAILHQVVSGPTMFMTAVSYLAGGVVLGVYFPARQEKLAANADN